MDDAHGLFLTLEITIWQGKNHPSAAWNALITAFDRSNRFQEAFALFSRMREDEVALEKYVAATILRARVVDTRVHVETDGKVAMLTCKL